MALIIITGSTNQQMNGLVFISPFYLSLLLSLASCVLIIVFKLLARRTKSKSKSKTPNLNLPPSPPKLPIIGNLHQLGTLPHRSFRDLSRKYGDMMLLQLGQRETPALVVSSGEVAMEILKTHDLAFSNRPQNTPAKILLYGCTDVGFGLYGENWRQKRKICVLQLLSVKSVQSFRNIREEEVAELVNKLREASCSSGACHVNLSEMLVSTSNSIVCKCSLGLKFPGDSDSRVKALARDVMIHLAAFTVRDYFPLFGWVDVLSGKIREIKSTFRELDALFDRVIAEHLGAVKMENDHDHNSKKKDFVDILLQLQKDSMLGFELTETDIKALLLVSFLSLINLSLSLCLINTIHKHS